MRCALSSSSGEGGKGERARRRYVRKRWPGWREAAEGQFQHLLRPEKWADMSAAERDIARARRTSAAFAPSGRHTQFDTMAAFFVDQRRGVKCPRRRRFIQRALLEVRRHQKQWRATQRVKTATAQGRNLAAAERPQHSGPQWQQHCVAESGRVLEALGVDHGA